MEKLKPYLSGSRPDERGEVELYCPLHNDSRRSASLNVNMGVWYCHAGCGGSSVRRLIEAEDTWVAAEGRVASSAVAYSAGFRPVNHPTPAQVRAWHRRLLRDEDALSWLREARGITEQTVRKARVGYDGRLYKIPVYSPTRELWNVRTYDPDPGGVRRKIWGVKGMNAPRLYPVGVLERTKPGDAIMICEGEWDTLLVLQAGYQAVTRTGAAKVWRWEWPDSFEGLRVYLCHDCDTMGQVANEAVAAALAGIADSVSTCRLPYSIEDKNGKDLTDFLLEQDDPSMAIGRLMAEADTT